MSWSCQRHWAQQRVKLAAPNTQIQSVDRQLIETLGESPDFEGE
jgi:hypothetical protein